MSAMTVISSIIVATILLSFCGIITPANAECGRALPKGSVLCNILQQVVRNLRFRWCTHGVVFVELRCEQDLCRPFLYSEFESVRFWWPRSIPLGMGVDIGADLENRLGNQNVRNRTIKELIKFMGEENLSFIHFNEKSWEDSFRNTSQRNAIDFIEELHHPLHQRGWHIGLSLQIGSYTFLAQFDFPELIKYVDWFNLPAHRDDEHDRGYLPILAPLDLYKDSRGTTKYWLEHLLERVKPECIVLEISTLGQRYTALESAVEPGPGSKADAPRNYVHITYTEACFRLLRDTRCREHWDDVAKSHWMVCGDDFYTYTSPRAVMAKMELALSYNVTRVLQWSLTTDDQDGICGNGKYPNLRAIQHIRGGEF